MRVAPSRASPPPLGIQKHAFDPLRIGDEAQVFVEGHDGAVGEERDVSDVSREERANELLAERLSEPLALELLFIVYILYQKTTDITPYHYH